MSIRRELALVSLASGAASIVGYIVIKSLLDKKKPSKQEASKIYEEKSLLDQYMLFNFAEPSDFLLFDLKQYSDINNCMLFPKRVALLCRDYCPEIFFDTKVNNYLQLKTVYLLDSL